MLLLAVCAVRLRVLTASCTPAPGSAQQQRETDTTKVKARASSRASSSMALCRSCQGSLPSLSCWKGAAVAATAEHGAQLKPCPVVPQTIQTIHSNRLPKHAALLGRCPAQPARSTARKVRAVLLVLLRVHDCNTPQIKVLITPHLIERLVWCWLEHKQSCDLALPATRKLSSAVQTSGAVPGCGCCSRRLMNNSWEPCFDNCSQSALSVVAYKLPATAKSTDG